MPDPMTTFESEEQAAAFCREREGEDKQRWIKWQLHDGRWTAAPTNLPTLDGPTGSVATTESKPEPADPRAGTMGGAPPVGG
jgi:hypothetical protein